MVSKDPLMIIEALWNFGSPIKSACNKMFCSVFRRWCDGGLAGADLLPGGGQHQPPVEHPRHPAGLHRPVEVIMILMTTYEFWCHVLFMALTRHWWGFSRTLNVLCPVNVSWNYKSTTLKGIAMPTLPTWALVPTLILILIAENIPFFHIIFFLTPACVDV